MLAEALADEIAAHAPADRAAAISNCCAARWPTKSRKQLAVEERIRTHEQTIRDEQKARAAATTKRHAPMAALPLALSRARAALEAERRGDRARRSSACAR